MSLRQVKNMGTEGRRQGQNELPADEKVLGNVKFRVDLIKTFKIVDKPEGESVPKEDEPEMDPAIVQSEITDNNENTENDKPLNSTKD